MIQIVIVSKSRLMEKSSKILEFPNKELLHAQAAAWITRMDNAKLTREEENELRQWVNQSEHHKMVLLDTAKVWDSMDVMNGLSELLSLEDLPEKRNAFFNPAIPAIAASLFCVGILAYYYTDSGTQQSKVEQSEIALAHLSPMTYKTPIGGNDVIDLTDGSVVKLNTATRIQVALNSSQRNITLLDGEAYFEVAKNEEVPFIVTVGNTEIQAVGTAFAVQKRADDIEVTVTEGLVQVERHRAQVNSERLSQPVLLRAGQLAQIGKSGNDEIKEIKSAEIARKLLWQQKMLAFDGDTLEQVIAEFSRYTSFKISIADAETAAIRVGGYFRSDDIAGLLTSLEDNFSISVAQTAADSFKLQKK